MRGEVLELNPLTGGGVIADGYGARYTFDGSATRGRLQMGDAVEFTAINGVASDIFSVTDTTAQPTAEVVPAGAIGSAYATTAEPAYDFVSAMFSFNGRLRRTHYWITWAILFAGGFVLAFIPFLNLLGFGLLWPHLAKDVKRMHDMGYTGWIAAIPFGIGLLGFFGFFAVFFSAIMANPQMFDTSDPTQAMNLFGSGILILLLIWVIQIAFWIWMGIQDSQPGRNAYGPNPKEAGA